MATLLESAWLIVRSQHPSRDGRVQAVAEDSINGHLRRGPLAPHDLSGDVGGGEGEGGCSPRTILAGKRILPAQAALEEHKDTLRSAPGAGTQGREPLGGVHPERSQRARDNLRRRSVPGTAIALRLPPRLRSASAPWPAAWRSEE